MRSQRTFSACGRSLFWAPACDRKHPNEINLLRRTTGQQYNSLHVYTAIDIPIIRRKRDRWFRPYAFARSVRSGYSIMGVLCKQARKHDARAEGIREHAKMRTKETKKRIASITDFKVIRRRRVDDITVNKEHFPSPHHHLMCRFVFCCSFFVLFLCVLLHRQHQIELKWRWSGNSNEHQIVRIVSTFNWWRLKKEKINLKKKKNEFYFVEHLNSQVQFIFCLSKKEKKNGNNSLQ